MDDNKLVMQVGAAIRRLRRTRGISQTTLARRAKLTRTYMSSVEAGRKNLTVRTLAGLARGLDAQIYEFFLPGEQRLTAPRISKSPPVGVIVRKLRRERGLSQQRFAKAARLNQGYLAGIETGKRNPTLGMLARIAEGLGVAIETLFSADATRDPRRCQG